MPGVTVFEGQVGDAPTAIAVRAENVDRMQFQSKAGVTSTTPSASHD